MKKGSDDMSVSHNNIVWHKTNVTVSDRELLTGQRGLVVLLTGLSGSGKSTIAAGVERQLYDKGRLTYILDGDNLRHGLNSDLTFEPGDRSENIRRIAEVSKLFADASVITLISFIAPYEADRHRFRDLIGERFIEIHIDSSVETCIERDPKGLYKKAIKGEITGFTGVDATYERPSTPDLRVQTDIATVEDCVKEVITLIWNRLRM